MRISATYIDRLIWNVMPWTIGIGLVVAVPMGGDGIVLIASLTLLYWSMDTLVIHFKYKPISLKIGDEGEMILNNEVLDPHEIASIIELHDARINWSFEMIKITLVNGMEFYFIDKPQNIVYYLLGKPSKSLRLLFKRFPHLENKLSPQEYL